MVKAVEDGARQDATGDLWRARNGSVNDLAALEVDEEQDEKRAEESIEGLNEVAVAVIAMCPMSHRCVVEKRTRLPWSRHFAATSCCRSI